MQSVNRVSTRHTGSEDEKREREFYEQEERMIEQIYFAAGKSGTLKESIPYSCNELPLIWGPLAPL